MNHHVVLAVFDRRTDAESAVDQLSNLGVSCAAFAFEEIAAEEREIGSETNESMDATVSALAGGGAVGAILGIATLGIPEIGPLAATGILAPSELLTGVVAGAVLGAVAGAAARLIDDHSAKSRRAQSQAEDSGGPVVVSIAQKITTGEARHVGEVLARNHGRSICPWIRAAQRKLCETANPAPRLRSD